MGKKGTFLDWVDKWQHGDRFFAALRLQTGTCAKR